MRVAFDTRSVDLIVMQRNKPMGIDSEFSEYFVTETAKMPAVDRVSEGVVSTANMQFDGGGVAENMFLVQGWKADNFGFESDDFRVLEGRTIVDDDHYKVMLGQTLARNLKKKVGDKFTFVADPDHPYLLEGPSVRELRPILDDAVLEIAGAHSSRHARFSPYALSASYRSNRPDTILLSPRGRQWASQ